MPHHVKIHTCNSCANNESLSENSGCKMSPWCLQTFWGFLLHYAAHSSHNLKAVTLTHTLGICFSLTGTFIHALTRPWSAFGWGEANSSIDNKCDDLICLLPLSEISLCLLTVLCSITQSHTSCGWSLTSILDGLNCKTEEKRCSAKSLSLVKDTSLRKFPGELWLTCRPW